MGEFWCCVNFL